MNRSVAVSCMNVPLLITIAAGGISAFVPIGATASNVEMYKRGFIELELEYVIGGEEADDQHALYFVLGYDVDSEGNVFVTDMKLNCVKKFDPSGVYLLTLGREGSGPGDFRAPAMLAVGPSGDLIVNDSGNNRIQHLTAVGKHINSVTFTDGFVGDVAAGPAGGFYATVQEDQIGPPTSPQKLKLLRLDDSLSIIDTIDEMFVQTMVIVGTADSYTGIEAPYPPSLEWNVLPDGRLIVGHSNTNRLRILSPSGGLIRTITLEWNPPPVTAVEREKYFGQGAETLQKHRASLKDHIKFPENLPYYTDIEIDSEGNILLRWPVPVDGRIRYDAFNGNGDYIARVTMDIYPEDIIFREGVIYARHGEFPKELPTIRGYRMK